MIDLLYRLFPQTPPPWHGLLTDLLRAAEEGLFFVFFVVGITAIVRLLLITNRR